MVKFNTYNSKDILFQPNKYKLIATCSHHLSRTLSLTHTHRVALSLSHTQTHMSTESHKSYDAIVVEGGPFTFSHLADAFIQSDLQGCIHIFTFTLMAHCTSGAIR